ncbi:hypothetical protein TeGR_g1559 [Tetraparma gracilis]|uniref:Uncharacterized protein n=1 Tax=Tetraparma gracilis TaxID=2962635 RepID=A0ABQ6MSH0_9STRA|nr:hypothetical protein TeGR_g1559 [Tetraparma gracilis]
MLRPASLLVRHPARLGGTRSLITAKNAVPLDFPGAERTTCVIHLSPAPPAGKEATLRNAINLTMPMFGVPTASVEGRARSVAAAFDEITGQIPPLIVAEGPDGARLVAKHMLSHPAAGVVILDRGGRGEWDAGESAVFAESKAEGVATCPLLILRVGLNGLGGQGRSQYLDRLAEYCDKMVEEGGRGVEVDDVKGNDPGNIVERIWEFYDLHEL